MHVLDNKTIRDIQTEEEIEQHFNRVTSVIERFAEQYGDKNLHELKTISTFTDGEG